MVSPRHFRSRPLFHTLCALACMLLAAAVSCADDSELKAAPTSEVARAESPTRLTWISSSSAAVVDELTPSSYRNWADFERDALSPSEVPQFRLLVNDVVSGGKARMVFLRDRQERLHAYQISFAPEGTIKIGKIGKAELQRACLNSGAFAHDLQSLEASGSRSRCHSS